MIEHKGVTDMTTFEHMGQTIELDGFTITARTERDDDATPPWKREDGHGEVLEWTSRDKKAGELTLYTGRYYDFAGAVKMARRDGWGITSPPEGATKRQIAALAAREDFERLRRWCNDDWSYVGVVVTVSARGVELGSASFWGIESDACDYLLDVANELLPDAMGEARKRIAEINAMLGD